MSDPREHRLRVGDVELCYFEWGVQAQNEPTVLLAHATGFHARCWDRVVAPLGGCHVIALDQRGHGRSASPEITHWGVFGEDLCGLVATLGLDRLIGVGHSMGGHAMTDAAAAEPDRFARLLLIDPVIAAPDDYGPGGWTLSPPEGESHPTSRRRKHFASPEAMMERFRHRAPYAKFDPACLRDYCVHGLRPLEEGFELACAPATEASVYMTSRTNPGVHESARALDIPVRVVRAKLPPPDRDLMDFSSSPTWPGLAASFRRGQELFLADRTHFIPMETPGYAAQLIVEELEAYGQES